MSYYITKSTKGDFDAVVSKVIEKLKDEGFGVLTEIDVANTLKQKLGVEMKHYRILGACNPGFAHKALSVEDKIGVMLPCNVVVQEKDAGEVDIAAIDPRVAMKAVENPALAEIAEEVAERLSRVVSAI
ncbi:MAG: DUF302 domain-containing protein [Methylocystis sp.]